MNILGLAVRSVRKNLSCKSLSVVTGCIGTTFALTAYAYNKRTEFKLVNIDFNRHIMTALCAESNLKPQKMVTAEDKCHGLFLIIHLEKSANTAECVKALNKIQSHIDRISPKEIRDDDNEIVVGLGFGPQFLDQAYPNSLKRSIEPYFYKTRGLANCNMPSTGGDILIHAVCNEFGKLFELTQAVLSDIPQRSISKTEEVYGFRYRNGRDLSGFIDGTENPAEESERFQVAVNKNTGGSYVVTQRWIHDMKKISTLSDAQMQKFIGRTKADSIEISPVAVHSHVGRMVAGLSEAESEKKRIVRHSMPYGTVTGDAGLYFIGYSSTPLTLDWMLDRMTGLTHDRVEDSLFNFTKPVTGTYFYVPSEQELDEILRGRPAKKSGWF